MPKITAHEINEQIGKLKKMRLDANNPPLHGDVRDKLIWEQDSNKNKILGIYAKWLIAVKIIFEKNPRKSNKVDLSNITGITPRQLRQIYGKPDGQDNIHKRDRFAPELNENVGLHTNKKTKLCKLNAALNRIVLTLFDVLPIARKDSFENIKNFYYEFLNESFLIPKNQAIVGDHAIDSFKNWLLFGQKYAVPEDLENSTLTIRQQVFDVRDYLQNPPSEQNAHKLIINVHCAKGMEFLEEFRQELALSIVRLPLSSRPISKSYSLAIGQSRNSVLKQIFTEFENVKLAEEIENRPIDLARDLVDFRSTLTGKNIFLIFHDFDNNNGPFSSLHEYCCNTNWAELIRVLVQPSQEKLFDEKHLIAIPYRIVVLSSYPVQELAPWTLYQEELNEKYNSINELNIYPSIHGNLLDNLNKFFRKKVIDDQNIPADRSDYKENLIKKTNIWLNTSHDIFERSYLEIKLIHLDMLKLIAASINGMRRATLIRCLEELYVFQNNPAAIMELKQISDFDYFLDTFLDSYSTWIKSVIDEEVEGLSAQYRSMELERVPKPKKITQGDKARESFRFHNREIRAIFTQAWIELDKNPQPEKMVHSDFEIINFILAEESLRQATSQLRNLESGASNAAYSTRRVVQAIYHGLVSINKKINIIPSTDLHTGGFSLTFPIEKIKRYHYLFSFLYREIVENGNWRLARSFGRSDVRLDLLTIFLSPEKGKWMITGYITKEDVLLNNPYEVEDYPFFITKENTDVKEFIDYEDYSPSPSNSAILRCDLLEALGRAGLEHDFPNGRAATEWACSVLPGWRARPTFIPNGGTPQDNEPLTAADQSSPEERMQGENWRINELLPSRESKYFQIANSALKLRLDLLQSSGDEEQLKIALTLCRQQLERLGINSGYLVKVSSKIVEEINCARGQEQEHANALNEILYKEFELIKNKIKSKKELIYSADIFARMARILATFADNQDANSRAEGDGPLLAEERDEITKKFAQSYAINLIGDRLRSSAGESGGGNWPFVGARNFRFYIRVTLKFAKLLVEDETRVHSRAIWKMTRDLMEHAQSRLGVYTRHHFQFRKERALMLLLEASWLETWCHINLKEKSLDLCKKILVCEKYISDKTLKFNTEYKDELSELSEMEISTLNLMEKKSEYIKIPQKESEIKLNYLLRKKMSCKNEVLNKYSSSKLDVSSLCNILDEQYEMLNLARNYIENAETLLISLGFQAEHVRRLCLARLKNTTSLIKVIDKYPKYCLDENYCLTFPIPLTQSVKDKYDEARKRLHLAKITLSMLTSITRDNLYWQTICLREEGALQRAQKLVDGWDQD